MTPLELLLGIGSTYSLILPSTTAFMAAFASAFLQYSFQSKIRNVNLAFYALICTQFIQFGILKLFFMDQNNGEHGCLYWMIRTLVVILLALGNLLSWAMTILAKIPNFPETQGPYRVGLRQVLVPDEGNHLIPLDVIFPTALKQASQTSYERKKILAYPHPKLTAKAVSRYSGTPLYFFDHWGAAEIEFDALEDVLQVKSEEDGSVYKWPLIVFSHGLCGDPATYSVIRKELASWGFIVVCATHNDGSASVIRYADGSHRFVELAKDKPARVEKDWRQTQVWHRQKEVSSVLDYLQSDKSEYHDFIDFTKIGAAGHSFGAATCIVSAYADKRIKCVVDLDGWMFPIPEKIWNEEGLDVPFLILMTEHFSFVPDIIGPEIKLFNNSKDPRNLMGVVFGTRHIDFSDTPLYYHPVASSREKKALSRNLPILSTFKYINGTSVWFFRKYLKNEESLPNEKEFIEQFLDSNVRVCKQGLKLGDLRAKKI